MALASPHADVWTSSESYARALDNPAQTLMDGDIGIGGDPAALLARAGELVLPGSGEVVVETAYEDVHEDHVVTFDDGGEPFGWSRIGTEALGPIAARLGFRPTADWTAGGRRFLALAAPERPTAASEEDRADHSVGSSTGLECLV